MAVVFGIAVLSSRAQSQTYRSVELDSAGQLSIMLSSGAVLTPPKLRDQVSFSQPMISGDHKTVAWLANYADSSAAQDSSNRIAGRLVLYCTGQVTFSAASAQIRSSGVGSSRIMIRTSLSALDRLTAGRADASCTDQPPVVCRRSGTPTLQGIHHFGCGGWTFDLH